MKYKLDIEDSSPDFESMAFLLFHTDMPNYAFVDDLNRLYSMSLERVDDVQLAEAEWPLYTYHDELRLKNYYLIERPLSLDKSATTWNIGHKLLIINGDESGSIVERITNEFNVLPQLPDADDLLGVEHYDILCNFHQNFTPVTLIDFENDTNLSRKGIKERNELQRLLSTIVNSLDIGSVE